MEAINKRRTVSLGIRIGTVFLLAILIVAGVVYFVMSQNFRDLFTDYTIMLVETMTEQGVHMVENELEAGRNEAVLLANAFQIPETDSTAVRFPQPYTQDTYLRMIYVTQEKTVASDGRETDLRSRPDVLAAFSGEVSVYGPYFNEENEFVVCYTAPVRRGEDIVGVLSLEEDGYVFCEIIKDIRFIDSGESYILNAEGTDIAVSDPAHIDWVNDQYNGQKLLEENGDDETRSIVELEQKGLNGETGVGTYYWEDGLVYVVYMPIPSENWVLLAGLREEEIVSLTKSTLFASDSQRVVLGICFVSMLFLAALIVHWIVSNMRENAEIAEKLKSAANQDALTGLMNRNSYNAALDALAQENPASLACVYIDANGLHELNNHLGHEAGDRMLVEVAEALRSAFPHSNIYRIGGDEFVVFCRDQSEADVRDAIDRAREILHGRNSEISIGVAWKAPDVSMEMLVNDAEIEMQEEKRRFYRQKGNERRMRTINKQVEQMIADKRDADTLLSVLIPMFNGVYFVDLTADTLRSLSIPVYFQQCLQDADNKFSSALCLYAERFVRPADAPLFRQLTDYQQLEKLLDSGVKEFRYEKMDGEQMRLCILRLMKGSTERQETLWIFDRDGDSNKA